MDAFAGTEPDLLPDLTLRLQPGLHYLEASWPVDDLIRLYLTEQAPDRFAVEPCDLRLEIRGARGEFRMNRLDAGAFGFRSAIANGASIAAAAELAMEREPVFDAGLALQALVAEGLVTAIDLPDRRQTP
jgi:hypothetical protein